MSSLADIKNVIIQWFWKMGFSIGKTLGTVGQNLFGDAVRAGFELTAIESIDLGSIMGGIQYSLENDLSANVKGVDAGLDGMTVGQKAEMFQGMFAEEYIETQAMEASNAIFADWNKTVGTITVDANGATFTADQAGPCTQYSKLIDDNDPNSLVFFVINTGDGLLMISHG